MGRIGANLTVELVGLVKTTAVLNELRKKYPEAFAGAVYMLATNVLSTSLKLAPADTGYLRASRYVRRPVINGTRFDCEVGYGAPYAIFVHEIAKRYVVGEWKFLSKAWDFHSQTALREIAAFTEMLARQGFGIDNVPETHPRIWTGGERIVARRKGKGARKAHLKQRAQDRAKNVLRIAAESKASLEAQRSGKRPPRPGRK